MMAPMTRPTMAPAGRPVPVDKAPETGTSEVFELDGFVGRSAEACGWSVLVVTEPDDVAAPVKKVEVAVIAEEEVVIMDEDEEDEEALVVNTTESTAVVVVGEVVIIVVMVIGAVSWPSELNWRFN